MLQRCVEPLRLALNINFEAPDGIVALSRVSGGGNEGEALEGGSCRDKLVNQSAARSKAEAAGGGQP